MKDSYVFKRIFIGVAIGIILMCVRSCDVFALSTIQGSNVPLQCRLYKANGETTLSNGTIANPDPAFWECHATGLSENVGGVWFFYNNLSLSPALQFNKTYKVSFQIIQDTIGGSNFTMNSVSSVSIKFGTNVFGRNQQCKYTTQKLPIYNSNNVHVQDREIYDVSCEYNDMLLYGTGDNTNMTRFNIYIKTISNSIMVPMISKVIQFEEITTNNDINNSINSTNLDTSDMNDNQSSDLLAEYLGDVPLGNLAGLPSLFLTRLVEDLTTSKTNNPTFTISASDLPLSSYVNYSSGITLQPLRTYITDIIGSNWYEWLGAVIGSLLVFKFLLNKGKSLFRMLSIKDVDNDMWGGVA